MLNFIWFPYSYHEIRRCFICYTDDRPQRYLLIGCLDVKFMCDNTYYVMESDNKYELRIWADMHNILTIKQLVKYSCFHDTSLQCLLHKLHKCHYFDN